VQIRPVGAELFHADGRMDMTKLIVAFCNFAYTPKNVYNLNVCHPRCVSTICNNKTIHHYPTFDCIKSKQLQVSAVRDSRNVQLFRFTIILMFTKILYVFAHYPKIVFLPELTAPDTKTAVQAKTPVHSTYNPAK